RKQLCGSPPRFTQGGCVYVGIKSNWHTQCCANRARKIVIPPSSFWCGSDVAECRRVETKIDGAKRANSDGLQFPVRMFSQEFDCSRSGGFGRDRRELGKLQIVGIGSDGADELCPASFNGAKHLCLTSPRVCCAVLCVLRF